MNQTDYVLQAVDLHKEIRMGQVAVKALRGVSMNVHRGELLSIIGPSGSGKSTLLGLIGGLDTPTSGQVFIDGQDITLLNEVALTRVRNEKIGFVFQFFNLVPTLTALENVALPIQFARNPRFDPTTRAKQLLDMLDMSDRMHHRPNQLSGGQQQRVAIARALANQPPIMLCDEPTGNLDSYSGALVMEALHEVQEQTQTTVIIVTHDMNVASQTDRLITLADGKVTHDKEQERMVEIIKEKRETGQMPAVQREG